VRQLRVTRRLRVRRDDDPPADDSLRTRSAPCDREDAHDALLHRIDEVLSEV
jgi:hypothetical protein